MPKKLTEATMIEGMDWLISLDPRFKRVFDQTGTPRIRQKASGFSGLLQSIVSQQLSTAAAKTIWTRVKEAGYDSSEYLAQAHDEQLRALGLSRQKIRYARALASATVDYEGLSRLKTTEVIDALTPILGIGEWTAQMYALFALGHSDVFAPNDLGLQEGLRKMLELDSRPSAKVARDLALPWSPWRSVASLALWSYNDIVS